MCDVVAAIGCFDVGFFEAFRDDTTLIGDHYRVSCEVEEPVVTSRVEQCRSVLTTPAIGIHTLESNKLTMKAGVYY